MEILMEMAKDKSKNKSYKNDWFDRLYINKIFLKTSSISNKVKRRSHNKAINLAELLNLFKNLSN